MGDMPWTRDYRVLTQDELDRLEERRKRRARLRRQRRLGLNVKPSPLAADDEHDASDADKD